ncbi:hypothetical protein [Paracoccus tegillarcae]|uniref:Mitochondrial inner membrane protein n=1 Tax=Paracoccus tegillarcae TaxID=1529068 RepID=A0A2K9EPV1_9RHOB|nr:hypothetical protein [Paracoccus tegillarcae]AUH33675.1 hypothetical protein CUV01_10005 [Paracoccus tegillarcae]
MKKPENKTSTPTSSKPGGTGKKPAAKSSTVKSTPVDAGSTAKAAATGGNVKPADSSILGDSKAPQAAAAKKTAQAKDAETAPTKLSSPQTDRIASADKDQKTEPAKQDKPGSTPDKAGSTSASTTPAAAKPASATTPAAKTHASEKPASGGQAAPRRSGFWPLALGGAVAAGLGAGAAILFMPQEPAVDSAALKQEILSEVQSGNAALRDETVAAARTEMAADIEALSEQAGEAGADAARQIIAEMPAGADTTPEVQAALEAQSQQIAALTEQLSAVQAGAAPVAASEGDGAATQQAEQAQQTQQELTALRDEIQQAAADAKAQLDAVKAEAEQMQQAAASSTQRAEAVAAVAALQSALDNGTSTEAAAQQLQDAGVTPPEAVTQDVPTLAALQDSFDPAARSALRTALRDDASGADSGTLIGNFLRAQTGARSVEPREGGDPDAVLSRADAAVQSGDINAALGEVQALPDVARQTSEMAEWITGAQGFLDARAALDELSGQSN